MKKIENFFLELSLSKKMIRSKLLMYISEFTGIFSFYLIFFTLEDIGIKTMFLRILFFVSVFLVIVVVAIVRVLTTHKFEVWSRGTGSLNVQYGNILDMAFQKNDSQKELNKSYVVIPVNTHFDVLVQDPNQVPHPLVSSKTVHGQWLIRYFHETRKTPEELQIDIYNYLDKIDARYKMDEIHSGGKRKYEIGTCALIELDTSHTFVLLAVSNFNKNNNAESTKELIVSAVKQFVKFEEMYLQGNECYIPLIGTGKSGAGLTHKQSLHTIVSTIELLDGKITSPINVVIYNGDKSKVSIYDY